MEREHNASFGVFKPVGHVVISFPEAEGAESAARELAGIGLQNEDVRRYSDTQMIEQIDDDIAQASPLAAVGQELNLIRAHRKLAEKGYHWLVVRAPDGTQAAQVADVARRQGAERAQLYGNFIIEELIERPGDLSQVAESPDRGLDAQTPSGEEEDAAALKKGGSSDTEDEDADPVGLPPR